MELLRRAILVGCLLSGMWLLMLAPLDPVVTITPVDFALRQKREADAVPDDRKTEAERRRALIPLSVYIEELLQFNVFSAAGPEWERFLRDVDARMGRRESPAGVFVRMDGPPMQAVADKLAAGGGTTYISISRAGGDVHYQVVEHRWTRQDFEPGRGFGGQPTPPASMLYPFRSVGIACMLAGLVLFLLLPAGTQQAWRLGTREAGALLVGVVSFALPIFAVGGSAQALTRAPTLTAVCWLVAALAIHVFAAPTRTAPDPLVRPSEAGAARIPANVRFFREGLAFLLMALGPLVFLTWVTMILWNR